jgi:hypothetical protein
MQKARLNWNQRQFFQNVQSLSCHLRPSRNSMNTTCRVQQRLNLQNGIGAPNEHDEIIIDYEAFFPV